jgi:hypothetical protein
VAMTGASLVMPRPAQAVSEYVVNGGYATVGAAAASLALRAARGGGGAVYKLELSGDPQLDSAWFQPLTGQARGGARGPAPRSGAEPGK